MSAKADGGGRMPRPKNVVYTRWASKKGTTCKNLVVCHFFSETNLEIFSLQYVFCMYLGRGT